MSLFRETSRSLTKRFLATLLLLTISSMISLQGCGEGSTDTEYVEKAKDYIDKEEFGAGIIELKNALVKNPENTEARWLLGTAYLEIHNAQAAEKELNRAVQYGLTPEAVVVPLARAALLQGNFQEIIDSSAETENLSDKDSAELWAIKGLAYLGLGIKDKAEEAFESSLDLNPDSAESMVGMAYLKSAEQELPQAREWLDRAFDADPQFASAWGFLGDLEQRAGNFKEAEQAYSKAFSFSNRSSYLVKRSLMRIALKDYENASSDIQSLRKMAPKDPRTAFVSGLLKFQQSQFSDAQSDFEDALRRDENYPAPAFYLGATHYAQGHFEQAQQYLNKYLAAYPNSSKARKLLGMTRFGSKDVDGAEALLKTVSKQDPGDVQTLLLLSDIAWQKGDMDYGISYLEQAIANTPDSSDIHKKLGMRLSSEGEYEQAIKELETAVTLSPDQQDTEIILVFTYLKAGNLEKALELAEQLRERSPDDPVPLNVIGLVYMEAGQELRAREALGAALKIAPGNPAASFNLARLEINRGSYSEAEKYYHQVLEHNPENLRALLLLAELQARLNNRDGFRDYLKQALQKHPSALQPRVGLAEYYSTVGESNKALSLLSEISDAYANNPDYLAVLGQVQLANGDLSAAERTLDRLLVLRPNSVQAHYLKGKLSVQEKDLVSARKHFDTALDTAPEHLGSKIALVGVLVLLDDVKEANNLLAELGASHPDDARVLELQGWVAMYERQPEKAVAAYQKAFEKNPNSRTLTSLSDAVWMAGDRDKAIKLFEKWQEAHPDDIKVLILLANRYSLAKHDEKAVLTLKKIISKQPENVTALNSLAWKLRNSDPEAALQYAERAYKLSPNSPAIKDTIGTILLELGKTERAIKELDGASQGFPDNLDIQYRYGLALSRGGNKEEARRILKKTIDANRPFENKESAKELLDSLQ